MGSKDYLILGLWNALCDRCKFKYKSNELRETWDHLMVCESCYETRHPQDFVRGVPDNMSVDWTRPDTDVVNGAPIVDVSPTFNCNSLEAVYLSSHFAVSTTIVKAIIMGPAIVDDGVTITIRCSLEVR